MKKKDMVIEQCVCLYCMVRAERKLDAKINAQSIEPEGIMAYN